MHPSGSAQLRDDLVYDVGMHRGEDTAYYLAKGYNVVAFEAAPDLVEHCRRRFAAEIESGALRIIAGAIVDPADVDGDEQVRFYRHPDLTMWGTIDAEWVQRREFVGDFEEISVPAIDFEATLTETGVPHFMKIDIEGADTLCLGALKKLEACPKYVSIESEKFEFAALEREFDALDALGYRRFAVVQQGSIPGTEIMTRNRRGEPISYRFERDASGGFGSDVGPWLSRDQALERYRGVFREYRMFGETSPVRKFRLGRIVLGHLPRFTKKSWPGWYDTHAARD
ncbi:MAG: FkbM family methyltransferase [Thermoleophilaceae bacterium]|nr:FkbM family methyltransferase [Thermoleophilaceae bacterium]